MWLIFAFSGPVLWAVSIHMDKYIIERFFKRSSVDVLIVFTALTGLVPLPPIGAFQPEVFAVPIAGVAVIAASGMLYMGGMSFYLRAL